MENGSSWFVNVASWVSSPFSALTDSPFSFQLWILTSHVELMFPSVWFCRQWPTVTRLFSQVEVGDVIRVNGSDFVPADAVILSSRYRSPSCCLTMENPFFLFLLSLLSLKKWWLDCVTEAGFTKLLYKSVTIISLGGTAVMGLFLFCL